MTNLDHTKLWRDKIRHVLSIYPRLSPSMLQVGLGTAVPRDVWRPVLEEMIATGEVVSEPVPSETPAGRQQTYTVLSLPRSAGAVQPAEGQTLLEG